MLDPNNADQSLQLMALWEQKGILFPKLYQPNPNDREAAYWFLFDGAFRALCLDPAKLSPESKGLWTCCRTICTSLI